MSGKHVPVHLKPSAKKSAEDWVTQAPQRASVTTREGSSALIKRLTIDVPEDLHRRLKVKAASEGVKMADLVRQWIEDGCAE